MAVNILIVGYICLTAMHIFWSMFREDVDPTPRGRKKHG